MSIPVSPVQPPPGVTHALRDLARRWADAKARERGNYFYIAELCNALGVEPPRPAGSGYEHEFPVKVIDRAGNESTNYVDLFKRDHFVLEAKHQEPGRSNDLMLRKAYGQARNYITHLPGNTPPYVLVLDIARTLIVWDRWEGGFGGFGAGKRIDLPTLHERPADIALLRDIWEQPLLRDPRARAQAVTLAIAAKLAHLAASLEERGHNRERVSRFLIRCVFTMFAEDVRLLPDEPFRYLVDRVAMKNPAEFVPAMEEMWRAMNAGLRFGVRKLLRFNGHFFAEAEALPLTREDLAVLLEAAEKDWSDVEPAIFGTLLTRALDPEERHRLGAEYTPPEFIARVVRPAVEEPIRERWTAVQAEVLQIMEKGTTPRKQAESRKAAEKRLREFHEWLRSLRFLDPACGSGNFLYVTMHAVKRIEVEVLNEIAGVTGNRELRLQEVDPSQFHGIEVQPWAREIAELTLWIGFHQFWRRAHGDVQPDEPILRDTRTLGLRDAVLTWDREKHDPSRDRPDPTRRIKSPVTGESVPDPNAKLKYETHVNARQTPWPESDFIIGNPPFLGKGRQRDAFGDGYVDALRSAYPTLPDGADYVMYWWHRAAEAVASGRTIRAGLITTESITQTLNRSVIAAAAEKGARVCWAIADHPWCDGGSDTAEVRVTMSVIAKDPPYARLASVPYTRYVKGDLPITGEVRVPRLNFDLTAHADVASAVRISLRSNEGLAACGFMLAGAGFVLRGEEARQILAQDTRYAKVVRPYRKGGELTGRPADLYVIDFGLLGEAAARDYPLAFDIVRDRVKPERDANNDRARRNFWWRFGRTNERLRGALDGLPRYIATTETAKHRMFTFLDGAVAADHMVICVASDDAFVLGVLSSTMHVIWALNAGGALEDKPRYNKSLCFDPYPLPDASDALKGRIRSVAEKLDAHRKTVLQRDRRVSMTGMYNVLSKLRSETELNTEEREINTLAACGTLRDLHDEIDSLVADAYGWTWPQPPAQILERLVALHDRRVDEERQGIVRWLRPEYQRPSLGRASGASSETQGDAAANTAARPALVPWPTDAIGQITALRALVTAGTISVDEAVARFTGARREIVVRHLETLAILGEIHAVGKDQYTAPAPPS